MWRGTHLVVGGAEAAANVLVVKDLNLEGEVLFELPAEGAHEITDQPRRHGPTTWQQVHQHSKRKASLARALSARVRHTHS